MIKIIKLIVFFTFGHLNAQENFYYCDYYPDKSFKNRLTIVLVFKADSVMTYLDGAGYIWWSITKKKEEIVSDYAPYVRYGEFWLKHKNAISYLRITPKIGYQLVTILPENVTVIVEYWPKKFMY